jgi:hypothetical protein
MIHFLPESFETETASPYKEAVARLASVRTALGVAEQVAGMAPGDPPAPVVPTAWPEASDARRRCFDTRSIAAAQAAVAGLEMLAAQRDAGTAAHPKSVEQLALVLRSELADLDKLFSL